MEDKLEDTVVRVWEITLDSQVMSVHCKKKFAVFPSSAGMSLTELSLDGNN